MGGCGVPLKHLLASVWKKLKGRKKARAKKREVAVTAEVPLSEVAREKLIKEAIEYCKWTMKERASDAKVIAVDTVDELPTCDSLFVRRPDPLTTLLTMVGKEMLMGVSGGQLKRVTTGTGEMPARPLLVDEISTGLDSFQIVKPLHIPGGAAVVPLLQPAPKTLDIILLSDGETAYREHVLELLEFMGFKCPERKGIVCLIQDIQHCQGGHSEQYRFVPVNGFAQAFSAFHVGRQLGNELAVPFDKTMSHPAALTRSTYGVSKEELLKACIQRELFLLNSNLFVSFQILLLSFITLALFQRTNMHQNSLADGTIFMGALFFSIRMILFNGFAVLSMTITKLPIIFKQRDLMFYAACAYALPSWTLNISVTLIEVAVWEFITYYVIGFDLNTGRLFKQYLLLLLTNQMANALFRVIGAVSRNMIVANTVGAVYLLFYMVLGGFTLSPKNVKKRWKWGSWVSPMTYSHNAISVNEFRGHSWSNILPGLTEPLGVSVFNSRGIFTEAKWYWIGVGALVGYVMLYNGLFAMALTYLKSFGKGQLIISEESLKEEHANLTGELVELSSRETSDEVSSSNHNKKGMVLPFAPISMTFDSIRYSVDMPEMLAEEVMELIELTPLREALVGLPGVNGLSTEQCKRLTIAVELVAKPSRLDARAAAIVMRTVRNTVDTGRTVVCTIHQPSIHIFEAFDELFLKKHGGEEIHVGPLGHHSCHLIGYFESIEGINKIKDGYNPATRMLEVSTLAQKEALGVNFSELYKNSELYRRNKSSFMGLQRIPVWWRWYYWACPVACWTLYGFVVSQFEGEAVEDFLKDYFGFRHDFLGVFAAAVIGFNVLFPAIFALSLKAPNF